MKAIKGAFPVIFFLAAVLIAAGIPAADDIGRAAAQKKAFIVRNDAEGPRVMAEGGLMDLLRKEGFEAAAVSVVRLTPEEKKEYGEWNQDALESRQIGKLLSGRRWNEGLGIGLLTNCVDLLGMLAGVQHLTPSADARPDDRNLQSEGLAGIKPLRVGLVYFDAHADFNTPETTMSGMLGGMDVAVAAGLCLERLRLKTGLDPALPTRYIVYGGLRDVDPLEQELLDRSDCAYLTVDDIRKMSPEVDRQMERLSRLTDVIYIHIDMDVLDPSEVRGHSLNVPQGPTSQELAAVLERMFRHPKAGAIGIASLPVGDRDPDGLSLKAAYLLIEGALRGYGGR